VFPLWLAFSVSSVFPLWLAFSVSSVFPLWLDIRKALIARKWRTGVIAEVEMTMDIPEYSRRARKSSRPTIRR
jgi:hypothetical protein